GFRYCFTPLPGYFSPFPHGTGPLSVAREYLGLGGGPPGFARDFPGPALLGIDVRESPGFRLRGCHPLRRRFPIAFGYPRRFLTPCRVGGPGWTVPLPR